MSGTNGAPPRKKQRKSRAMPRYKVSEKNKAPFVSAALILLPYGKLLKLINDLVRTVLESNYFSSLAKNGDLCELGHMHLLVEIIHELLQEVVWSDQFSSMVMDLHAYRLPLPESSEDLKSISRIVSMLASLEAIEASFAAGGWD